MAGNLSGDSLKWSRSTRCGASMACVEVAIDANGVHVRDTKNPGEILFFTHHQWSIFVDGLR